MIPRDFYLRKDVTQIAKDLLGSVLCVNHDGVILKGMVVETEAYSEREKACHAYLGNRTERTSTLFMRGGTAYVYLVYGMYHLFNVVTNEEGTGEAVLIRGIEPIIGVEDMINRRGRLKDRYGLTSGPGKLTIAMGIGKSHNKADLLGESVWFEKGPDKKNKIIATTRVGIDYAGEDALLPWRYYIEGNPWVSRPR